MTALAALWLPILLSAVFVFVVSSIIHMVLPIHRKDFGKVPDEDEVRAAIRKASPAPGQYMIPCAPDMQAAATPEFKAKLDEGPVATMIVRPNGLWGLGPALLKWFVFSLVVSTFCAYLTAIRNAPGAEAKVVFQMTGAIATLGYVFSHVHEWTWKGLPTAVMVRFAIDGAIYAMVTAATFAWLWPAAA
ncbi:MAG: hypothetical protein NXI31_21610 [bacterium]|nr:hypothetical protein [bacterium]